MRLALETIVIIIIVLVVLVSLMLYFTGSSSELFGKVGSVKDVTTDPADIITSGYSDTLDQEYFEESGSDIFG